jgi:hypothetical protein
VCVCVCVCVCVFVQTHAKTVCILNGRTKPQAESLLKLNLLEIEGREVCTDCLHLGPVVFEERVLPPSASRYL